MSDSYSTIIDGLKWVLEDLADGDYPEAKYDLIDIFNLVEEEEYDALSTEDMCILFDRLLSYYKNRKFNVNKEPNYEAFKEAIEYWEAEKDLYDTHTAECWPI